MLDHPADPTLEWATDLLEPLESISELQGAALASGDGIVWSGIGVAPLDLETPVSGDFELGFELTISRDVPSDCEFVLGLLSGPVTQPESVGVLARFRDCNETALLGSLETGGFFDDPPDACDAQTLEIPVEVPQRLVLRRTGGHVTLASTDSRSCDVLKTDYSGALPPLRTLVFGSHHYYYPDTCAGAVSFSELSLRLLDDPEECPSPNQLCPGDDGLDYCIDVAESQEHCGSCGSPCPLNGDCADGNCRCATGYESCADGCTDLMTSTSNCGSCNHACSSHCFLGECDVGEACSTPKSLPPNGGNVHFDLADLHMNVELCEFVDTGNDAVFAWTPSTSGEATIHVSGPVEAQITLGVALADTCDLPYSWLVCAGRYTVYNEAPSALLWVQAGTTYSIIVSAYYPSEVTLEVEML